MALIDGEVQPQQYEPARIRAADVQMLLRKVTVTANAALSAQFPQLLPARIEVEMEDGTIFRAERDDYHGFHTKPFDWTTARAKFDRVSNAFTTTAERDAIAETIATLDGRPIAALTSCSALSAPTRSLRDPHAREPEETMSGTTFSFGPRAARSAKPRKTGITEIRGPYYSAYGSRHLADLLDTVGAWIDGIKYAGGSFALMPPDAVKSINKLAHDHDVYVSTGGWIENVLRFGQEAVDRYIEEAKALG